MATILLTGATGTVGSTLAPLLKERGHKIIYLTRAKNEKRGQVPFLKKRGQAEKGSSTFFRGTFSEPQKFPQERPSDFVQNTEPR